MTVLKYDVSRVEVGGGEDPPDGAHRARIHSAEITEPEGKDSRLEVWYEIIPAKDGPLKGKKFRRLPEYINLVAEGSAFRLRAVLEAVGKVKPGSKNKKEASGQIDIEKELTGSIVVIRTAMEEYPANSGQFRAAVKAVLPSPDADAEEPDEPGEGAEYAEMDMEELEELAEERELDLDDIYGTTKSGAIKKRKLVAALEEFDEGDGEPEPEPDEEPEDEYDSWTIAKLRRELKSRGMANTGPKEDLIADLRELDAGGEPEPEEEPGETSEYDELDDDELVEALEEAELEPPMVGRGRSKHVDREKAIEMLSEAGGDSTDDYDEWDVSELKEECKDRGLKETGGKNVLIKRLREDDSADD